MSAPRMLIAICLLLGLASAGAQTAEEWARQQEAAGAKSDRIMAEAIKHKSLLAQYLALRQAYGSDNSPAFRLIFGQYISWYLSFIGDYPAAMRSFSVAQQAQREDRPSPLAPGSGYAARPALDAIPELAKNYRIVLFNEAHHIALSRSLTVQCLSRLRQQGFDYFAAETLSASDSGLQARGYPTDRSGFYTEEPVYAEMVRTALKLGFKVVAYEAGTATPNSDARETEQARNLYAQVFEKDPHARLVINAGYDHIVESGPYLGGSSMAEHLYRLTHLPMLSIEQTMLYPHPDASADHPYYTAAMHTLHPQQPIIFVDQAGKPWSLRKGYDASVFFAPEKLERGRPTWLALGGLRVPRSVSADHCQNHYPCLVEARYAEESAEAIPADRLVLDRAPINDPALHIPVYTNNENVPSADLYLRPGRYRLSFSDSDGHVLHKQDIVVDAATR